MSTIPTAGSSRPPRKPQQERSKRTVEAILDAAAAILATPGRDVELNMRALARAAGVGPATLYEYFPTLEAVREALELRTWHRLLAKLQCVLEELRGAPLDVLVRRLTEVAMAEMIVPARLYGLQPTPKWFDRRVKLVKGFVKAARGEFVKYDAARVKEDPDMALTVVAHAVVNLIRIGVQEYPDHYQSGRYTKQVVDMIVRFLCRTDGD